MLAIVFGCQRFHQYLYGKEFLVETDHRPLESIFKKELNKCPMRLQRLRITLQPYQFIVKYKPGTQMYLADALSRASCDDKNINLKEEDIKAQVNMIRYHDISPKKIEKVQEETAKDPVLQKLKSVILESWPNSKKDVNEEIKPY